jgi:hypothetical protein
LEDRDDALGSAGNSDAELSQETAHGVDATGPCSEPGRAQPVQGGQRLLVDRLDGHGLDLLVAMGFEQALGVGSVGLVSRNEGSRMLRREQQTR